MGGEKNAHRDTSNRVQQSRVEFDYTEIVVDRQPTYRQRQAAATRVRVVRAARRVFARRGYGAATVAEVARSAGVAVPTVYKLYGSKRALLAAVGDAWAEQFAPQDLAAMPQSPLDALAWWAAFARRQWESGLDVAMIYAAAITSEPDVQQDLEPRLADRERLLAMLADILVPQLSPGMTREDAIAVLGALTLPEVYRELVNDRGWTPDQYERWTRATLTSQLVTPTNRT
jgi:AcrR family transcriptional regulator